MSPKTAPIIVATDFSTRSDRALRRATMIAKALGAPLRLVHVVDSDQPAYLIDPEVEASRTLIEESARTLSQIDEVPAEGIVIVGDVFSGILQAAEEESAGLIVLGPHRRLLRDAFIGTTAERAIAHSRSPVLLAAGVPSAPYDHALIALEMDEVSRSTVRRVQELGVLKGIVVTAMHALDAVATSMMRRSMAEAEAINHYVETERQEVSKAFSAFLTEAGLHGAQELITPIFGTPARTIREIAKVHNASLIVVGTSQKTGIKRMVLGSVAEDVLGDAECDVLVVPED